jgi:hypothetical protein
VNGNHALAYHAVWFYGELRNLALLKRLDPSIHPETVRLSRAEPADRRTSPSWKWLPRLEGAGNVVRSAEQPGPFPRTKTIDILQGVYSGNGVCTAATAHRCEE